MEIGEPDFVSPQPIIQAGIRALEQGKTHYTPAAGLPELRHQITDYYRRRFSVSIHPDQILITPGASGALQLALSALIEPGDKVMLADPGYPCNRNLVLLAGGEPVIINCGPETGYQLTPESIRENWQAGCRAVILPTPSNPTGACLSVEEISAINAVVQAQGGTLIVDEIYQGLTYDSPSSTALECSNRIIVVNSFSKYFGMTGWRLGWLVAPMSHVADMDKIAQNLFLTASTPAQYAALAAFSEETHDILEARRDIFRQRRDYLMPVLQEVGFEFAIRPGGAFYLYANCQRLTDNSFVYCQQLLEEVGVAITPGIDFGCNKAAQHVRFAYTVSLEKLQEGVRRISAFSA